MTDGAKNLDIYDAACVALADLDAHWDRTEFTFNPKGRQTLMDELIREIALDENAPPPRSANPEVELARLRAEKAAAKAAREAAERGEVES